MRRCGDLIAFTDGSEAGRVLAGSTALAAALDARLQIALLAPSPAASRYAPNIDVPAVERMALAGAARASACRAEIERKVGARIYLLAGEPEHVAHQAADLALHADLALLPDDHLCANPPLRDLVVEALLDHASCPVLILRDRPGRVPAACAAIAWNASKESSRAWRDSLPLLADGARRGCDRRRAHGKQDRRRRDRNADGRARRSARLRVPHACDSAASDGRGTPPPPAKRLVEFEDLVRPDILVMGAGEAGAGEGLSELTRAMIRDGRSALLLSR